MTDYRSPEAQRWRQWYKTARWLKVRAAQIQAYPLCERCSRRGKTTLATVCHHVDPSTKASVDTFYNGPFASLCAPCHDGPTQQVERIGFETTIGLDGWPTDDRHPSYRTR